MNGDFDPPVTIGCRACRGVETHRDGCPIVDLPRLQAEIEHLRGQLRCESAVRIGTERAAEILIRERDEARANHRHEMELRAACLVAAEAAAALLDNMVTLDDHHCDFAVRGIDVERLRAALDGRRPER